jgi:glycosyltransferase involved in cell wall biosynthesis
LTRVVVATGDVLGAQLAGAGIRAWNIASHLARDHEVRLLSTTTVDRPGEGFEATAASPAMLREAMQWCDVFIAQGWVLARDAQLAKADRPIVIDLYDPMHLEQLEQGRESGTPEGRLQAVRDVTGVLNEQIVRGDYFICASEKQRDFWLGQLAGLGRINPATYDDDPTLRSLLDVVPFGVPDASPVKRRPVAKGVIDGIGADDHLLLWGGGIYNWFDPLTLLRAIDQVRARVPSVRLLFLGVRHPNPDIPDMRMAAAAQSLASELGLLGSHVFFNQSWVPYDERADYLLEADAGVSTHLQHVETEFAFRTRLLDCIWAHTPIIATKGDALGDLVGAAGLGVSVEAGDVDGLAAAIERVLSDETFQRACREALAQRADELRWSTVLAPLAAFCRAPRIAPDRGDPLVAAAIGPMIGVPRRSGWRHDLGLAVSYLSEGGPKLLVDRVRARVRHRRDEQRRLT